MQFILNKRRIILNKGDGFILQIDIKKIKFLNVFLL